MVQKKAILIVLVLLFGVLAPVLNLKSVKADGGMIYIQADGSINPPSSSITSLDNVTYNFVANISSQITIERSGITVEGNGFILQGNGSGVGFYCSNVSNIAIEDTTIMNFGNGVFFTNSSNDLVLGDNITDNSGYGILLLFTSMNTVASNSVTHNNAGIWFDYSTNNTLARNNITDNYFGVGVQSYSTGNMAYHNNFINNHEQVVTDLSSANSWDNGYPDGGNYWDTYYGTDIFSGKYQNETGSDAIGDQPYSIDQNNTDNYPLIYPWPPIISAFHFTVFKTVIGQGYTTAMNVSFENLGNEPEVFNATIYANSTLIDSVQSTLNMTNRIVTITFTWNTTGFNYGNYVLTATAGLNGSENATASSSTRSVIVTIPGDINGDLKVSLADLVILAESYNSEPSGARYNPNADIDSSGIIGLSDLTILALDYHHHYP